MGILKGILRAVPSPGPQASGVASKKKLSSILVFERLGYGTVGEGGGRPVNQPTATKVNAPDRVWLCW